MRHRSSESYSLIFFNNSLFITSHLGLFFTPQSLSSMRSYLYRDMSECKFADLSRNLMLMLRFIFIGYRSSFLSFFIYLSTKFHTFFDMLWQAFHSTGDDLRNDLSPNVTVFTCGTCRSDFAIDPSDLIGWYGASRSVM